MIDITKFKIFIKETFHSYRVQFDEFKVDLQFVNIDCLKDPENELTIELSNEAIKVSTISKAPVLDFSLYEYSFDDINKAESFLLQIKSTGIFPRTGHAK